MHILSVTSNRLWILLIETQSSKIIGTNYSIRDICLASIYIKKNIIYSYSDKLKSTARNTAIPPSLKIPYRMIIELNICVPRFSTASLDRIYQTNHRRTTISSWHMLQEVISSITKITNLGTKVKLITYSNRVQRRLCGLCNNSLTTTAQKSKSSVSNSGQR